jgi:hypothetical protein
MFRTRFLAASLAGLIIVGLLILGGFAIYRIGWTEGYGMGRLAVGTDGGVLPPYGFFGFGFPGFLLTLGVILLLLVVIGRVLRFWMWGMFLGRHMMPGGRWKMADGPASGPWARHWQAHGRHAPPWYWDWEEAEPGQESDATRAQV